MTSLSLSPTNCINRGVVNTVTVYLQMTFAMYAASPDDAESWSKSISNILWGQLKQIKRDRDMSRIKKTRGAVKSRGALPRIKR